MRKFFLLFFLLNFTIITHIFAQQDTTESRNKYEIAAGFCKPLGDYKYIADGENTAFAQNGIYLLIAAKNQLNSYLGIKFSASVLINPAHNDIFARAQAPESTLSVKNWINSVFGIGTFFYFGGETSGLEIGLNVGLMTLSRPKISYIEYNQGSMTNGDYMKHGLGFGIAIFPEIALVQKMSGNKELRLFANYYYAPAYVEYKRQTFFSNDDNLPFEYVWVVTNYTDRFNVSVANIGVGLVF